MTEKSDGILTFEVTLKSQNSDAIKQLIQDAKEIESTKQQEKSDLRSLRAKQRAAKGQMGEEQAIAQMIQQFGDEATQDAIGNIPEVIDNLKKTRELMDTVDEQGLNNIRAFAVNPEAMIGNKLLSILSMAGPYGAIGAAIIGIVISAPEVFKAVIEALAVKGGPLNLDFRYSLEEQLGQEFDRQLQFRRITGDSPIITVDTHGYIAGDPNFSGNSLVDSEITRTNRIGIHAKSLGFSTGI